MHPNLDLCMYCSSELTQFFAASSSLPWEANTLVIWDNQCCMHAVVPYDYAKQSRKMWRVTIGEDEVDVAPHLLATVARL